MSNVYENYRLLACGVIAQLVNDWLRDKRATDYDLYQALQKCVYFDFLDLDRDYFYVKCRKLKEKGVKSVRFKNNGTVL